MLKIVVLTGAGVSADSGIPTYRSSDGLWANYKIEEVCTPEALERDRAKVINFYNMRRKEMAGKQPNAGHKALAELEKYFDVEIVTQNIDNLHELAGSTKITHLHGELTKLRSSENPDLLDIKLSIPYEVYEKSGCTIENIYNYPNPMDDNTNFTFEHNQKDNEIDVIIRIYDVMGQLVKTITEHRYGTTARIEPIKWDGKSDSGADLGTGIYVYNVTIKNQRSEETSGYSRLIIK